MRENKAVNDVPAVAIIRNSEYYYPISPALAPALFTLRQWRPSARVALAW